MYEKDGIIYAGTPCVTPRVIFAEYLGSHTIRVSFNTGETVDVDFRQGFEGSAFDSLREEPALAHFEILHGTLTWLDGEVDVAPEYLLEHGCSVTPAMPEWA